MEAMKKIRLSRSDFEAEFGMFMAAGGWYTNGYWMVKKKAAVLLAKGKLVAPKLKRGDSAASWFKRELGSRPVKWLVGGEEISRDRLTIYMVRELGARGRFSGLQVQFCKLLGVKPGDILYSKGPKHGLTDGRDYRRSTFMVMPVNMD